MAGPSLRGRRSRGGGGSPAPTTPSGYDPADLQAAYGLTTASANDGAGNTVAIVDAYSDPDALSNLSTYRSQWGLEPVCSGRATGGCITFTQESQSGTAPNVGWSEEISVDLDMVSAICPSCNILLVEASSPTFASLGNAENTAAKAARVVSIGNSYAGGESSTDLGYTTLYYSHPGIAITAATGDSGYAGGVAYPAASPDVIAVGGTTLEMSSTIRESETAWSGAGSGCSAYEPQPSWQSLNGNITSVCGSGKRALADVSAVADPNTGVAVYDTYGLSGWTVFGGTSVSTQIISAIYGLAGGLGAKGAAGGASGLYASPGDFFNIASGSNGSCGTDLCNAAAGWNGAYWVGHP